MIANEKPSWNEYNTPAVLLLEGSLDNFGQEGTQKWRVSKNTLST
jgi:hypothetical protein